MKLNFCRSRNNVPVIIHGLFGSMGNVRPIARTIESDYEVHLLEMRNHDDSPHDDEMSFNIMADDVIEYMDYKEIEKAYLVGHSMGGKIAMQIALNYPEHIKKLIVADIYQAHYPNYHNALIDGFYAILDAKVTSRHEADKIMMEYSPSGAERSFLLKNLYRKDDGTYGLKLKVKAIDNNYSILREAPTGNPYREPTLFIKGKDSAYIQAKHKETILELFPNVSLKIIENTGHYLHVDKSKVFNGIVKGFLEQDMEAPIPQMPPIYTGA